MTRQLDGISFADMKVDFIFNDMLRRHDNANGCASDISSTSIKDCTHVVSAVVRANAIKENHQF